jgi:hypothetical protein
MTTLFFFFFYAVFRNKRNGFLQHKRKKVERELTEDNGSQLHILTTDLDLLHCEHFVRHCIRLAVVLFLTFQFLLMTTHSNEDARLIERMNKKIDLLWAFAIQKCFMTFCKVHVDHQE